MTNYQIKILFYNLLVFFTSILFICILKNNFVYSLYAGNSLDYIYKILCASSDNVFLNIIWMLPIIANFYFVARKIYEDLLLFNVRYKNRRMYIKVCIFKLFLISFIINFFSSLIQIIIFSQRFGIVIGVNCFEIIFHYIFDLTLFNFIVIFVALVFRNFIYIFIFVIIFINVLLLIMHLNIINLLAVPFFNLYGSSGISIFSLILMILIIFFLYSFYLRFDIGGELNHETKNC